MPGSAIGDRFEKTCRDRPDAAAVRTVPDGTVSTFADLSAEAAAIGRALEDFGIRRGDAVVSIVGNRSSFFSMFVACMDAGVALVPLGDATDTEALAVIEQSQAVAAIVGRELPLRAVHEQPLAPGLTLLKLMRSGAAEAYQPSVVLKLTSGSTNLPKAALAGEEHLINDGRHIIDAMGIASSDVNLACIPLSHSYAIGNIVMPLVLQGTSVALRQSFSPSQFVRDVSDSAASVFPGVPFMFERLRSGDDLPRLPSSLRLLITAGAPIDGATVRWFRDRHTVKVHSFYGSSETGGIAYDDSEEVEAPLDVGRALPETTITLEDQDGATGAGRVFVQGNAVAYSYAHQDDDESTSAFVGGGFLTSDLASLSASGRLVLAGRVSPLVNVAGRKVDPTEVERRLRELPGIADARVLGMPCETRGQQVVAFLVRTDLALTPLAIRRRCAEALSTHKIPRRFVFVDRFPVDSRGKLDRRALQQLVPSGDE